MNTGHFWQDAIVERLKTMWADGISATGIAMALGGGITRNAVIGKVHRMGLSGGGCATVVRAPRITIKRDRVVGVTPRTQKRAICAAPHPDAFRLPNGELVGTADLQTCHCRWPHGDVGAPGFHYCGQPPVAGSPWCDFHKVRASEKAHAPSPERGSLGRKAEQQFARMWGGHR